MIDILYAVMAVAWTFVNFKLGDNIQAVVWVVIFVYCVGNYVNRKLVGSKYDY